MSVKEVPMIVIQGASHLGHAYFVHITRSAVLSEDTAVS